MEPEHVIALIAGQIYAAATLKKEIQGTLIAARGRAVDVALTIYQESVQAYQDSRDVNDD